MDPAKSRALFTGIMKAFEGTDPYWALHILLCEAEARCDGVLLDSRTSNDRRAFTCGEKAAIEGLKTQLAMLVKWKEPEQTEGAVDGPEEDDLPPSPEDYTNG